jgi:hypothetical protein
MKCTLNVGQLNYAKCIILSNIWSALQLLIHLLLLFFIYDKVDFD